MNRNDKVLALDAKYKAKKMFQLLHKPEHKLDWLF